MSTGNISFYEEISKIIPQVSNHQIRTLSLLLYVCEVSLLRYTKLYMGDVQTLSCVYCSLNTHSHVLISKLTQFWVDAISILAIRQRYLV